jgi:hypothetical protein
MLYLYQDTFHAEPKGNRTTKLRMIIYFKFYVIICTDFALFVRNT